MHSSPPLTMSTPSNPGPRKEALDEQVAQLLAELRTVLPGVQALFGFQLVVVFNQRFANELSPGEQRIHLALP